MSGYVGSQLNFHKVDNFELREPKIISTRRAVPVRQTQHPNGMKLTVREYLEDLDLYG
jgi:hypothetical protein